MPQPILDIIQQPRVTNHLEVLFWPLVLTLIVIALVRFRSAKTVDSIFRIAGNNGHMHLHLREGFSINSLSSLLLQVNFFIIFGVILYTLYDHYLGLETIRWDVFFICVTAPSGYYFLKFILVQLLSFLSDTQNGFFEYLTNYKVFFQIQGILLLPIAVALLFVSHSTQYYLAFIAIGLIGLISIFRTILSFLYAIRYGFFVLYIFLYLCTLEILPLVVIYKLFDDRIL